ncbi:MAG: heme ABC exporter ATP-binding protein CcmA [Anaerolineae bacterium]|nr:heme ABC exporter ATP-binding protein CcmA [Anaerolineae bacterium]
MTPTAHPDAVIEVHRLVKRFGTKMVLRQLEFSVSRGQFVALLGPNGAGKTTLLRILATLSRPTLGEVRVAGFHLPQQAPSVRRMLGVVSHLPLLYGDLSAEDNLRFYARLYDLPSINERVTAVLELVGLASRRRDQVRTYSRGMQQRLAIGRAVLHDPVILLLDEPHTGLDQDASQMLDETLRQVVSGGCTVVMASHDLSRALDLANRFDIIGRGQIIASVTRDHIPNGDLLGYYREVTHA